jgi:hypothetical protein
MICLFFNTCSVLTEYIRKYYYTKLALS